MYEPKPKIFKLPKTNRTIWRYLDLDKYYSMLKESALFFANVRKFEDIYEGHHGIKDLEEKERFYKAMLGEHNINFEKNASKMQTDPHVYVNCWHINNYESAALWDLYAGRQNGIAIRTNIRNLCDSIVDDYPVHVGKAEYIDSRKKNLKKQSQIEYYLVKRKSFKHENELRCVFFDQEKVIPNITPINENGILVKVDLLLLIGKIFVHPMSKPYLKEAVQLLNQKFGLGKKTVEKSALYDLV